MTAHSTGRAPAAGPASSPTAVTDGRIVDPSKRRRIHPAEPTVWQRRTYNFGRYAVIAIPIFALIAGLLPRSSAAFSLDPAVYAHYLATGRWSAREGVATLGLAITGVLSIVGLASLLFRGRARGYALAGLIAGLAGSAGMLTSVGSMVIREDRMRSAFVHGHWSQLAVNARTTGGGTATLAAGGAVLLALGWILLGVAVLRTSGMNRADGPLLIICTPLIFLGGFVLHVLPTMGSFLLLAAGLGIVFTASRISVIGEETWSQRRRRPPITLTGPAGGPPTATAGSAAGLAAGLAAESDPNDQLDRAAGLAGSLGLARPRLFPEHQVASAAIYHAPTTSAAEAGDTPDGLTTVPATPEPNTPEPAGSEPARPEPAAAPASEPVAESNGNGVPASHAPSNGSSPSRDDTHDGAVRNGSGQDAHAQSGSAQSGSDQHAAAQNGSAQNGRAQNGSAQNGGAQNGKPAGDGGSPATKSLRDLLRGARGAAAAWPTYRSRSGSTNGGPARNDGGRTVDPAGANRRNGGRPDSGAGKGTNLSSAAGRSSVSSASNGGPRSGVGKGSASKPKKRPTKPSGRSDTARTNQPPPDPASGEPDPSTGPPTARE